MTNKLTALFDKKKKGVLNIYCTAGFPKRDSLFEILPALQDAGADIIEIGMPYSDPLADGPVIQHSNSIALENGMTISLLLEQLGRLEDLIDIPIVLMGYFNPVLQYGVEKFCADAAAAGVAGIILPDLPAVEYKKHYSNIFEQYDLSFIPLITPETDDKRIKQADKIGSGFLYAVSSSATTGGQADFAEKKAYFQKLTDLKLSNPLLIGFGIKTNKDFEEACAYAAGGIIGSAFITKLENSTGIPKDIREFIREVRGEN
jgi:tryptophan synthase alpha chain